MDSHNSESPDQSVDELIWQHRYQDPTQGWVYPFYSKAVTEEELEDLLDFRHELLTLMTECKKKNNELALFLTEETFCRLMTMADRFRVDYQYEGGQELDMEDPELEPKFVYYLLGRIYAELDMMVILSRDDLMDHYTQHGPTDKPDTQTEVEAVQLQGQAQLRVWLGWMIDTEYSQDPGEVQRIFSAVMIGIGANSVLLDILTAAVELLWKIGYRDAYLKFKGWMQDYQWQGEQSAAMAAAQAKMMATLAEFGEDDH